jgi:large subunit ribosomal protein L25
MNASQLSAESRAPSGKGAARKLRAAGRIPALIYRGGNEPTHISVDPSELRLIFFRSKNPNTVLSIDVDGSTHLCLLSDTQKHPVSRDLLHADFLEIAADAQVTVNVPVRAEGKAKGMVVGGKLQRLRRTVPVRCLPKDIPAEVVVDITDLDINEFVRVSALPNPEGGVIVYENEYNVLSLKGRRTEADDEDGDEEGDDAAETAEA